MKALTLTAPRATKLVDIPRPRLGEEEVLLRVRRVGLCGTDLSSWRGANSMVSYPRIPGHELAGTVVAVGGAVPDRFQPDQDVIVFPYKNCASCTACRVGRPNCCRHNATLGVQREGGLCEFIAVPWDMLFASPRLGLRAMTLVEPLAVGHHAMTRGRVSANDTVAVIGCGAIGAALVASAVARGARVIAIDIDDRKLRLARLIGAAHAVNSASTDLHAALVELTNGDGPDVVVEAVGSPRTFQTAVDEAAFAGRVVCLGFAKHEAAFSSRVIVERELDIVGSRNALASDFIAAVSYLETGAFPEEDVVTHEISIAEAGAAFAAWDATPGDFCKIHVNLDE